MASITPITVLCGTSDGGGEGKPDCRADAAEHIVDWLVSHGSP